MDINATPAAKIARIYRTQTKIAELNKKVNIKSVQGQVDKVVLSPESKQLSRLRSVSNILAQQRVKGSKPPIEPKIE